MITSRYIDEILAYESFFLSFFQIITVLIFISTFEYFPFLLSSNRVLTKSRIQCVTVRLSCVCVCVRTYSFCLFMSASQDEDRVQYFKQAEIHIVCILKQTTKTGCNITHIALPTIRRPIVPPGKKLTRYHINATSCTPTSCTYTGNIVKIV